MKASASGHSEPGFWGHQAEALPELRAGEVGEREQPGEIEAFLTTQCMEEDCVLLCSMVSVFLWKCRRLSESSCRPEPVLLMD